MKSDSYSSAQKRWPTRVLKPASYEYPLILKQCFTTAPTLFIRGNAKLLSSPNILAVVGSRSQTETNTFGLTHILEPLRTTMITIVSGLALGMDSLAHTIALANSIPTIAVLGSSVEHGEIYPRHNEYLA